MRTFLSSLVILTFSIQAYALVDMRNANYTETWIDLDSPSSGTGLKVQRTYNSRSIHNGLFGFGWCSDFETKLTVTPQNTLKVRECGAGAEVEYTLGGKEVDNYEPVINSILAEVKKRNKGLDAKYFKNLETEIKKDPLLRDEFIRQLDLQGEAKSGTKYIAIGRSNEYVVRNANTFSRRLSSGSFQEFNKDGNLISQRDPNGNSIKLSYAGTKLTKVQEDKGSSLQFKYAPGNKYVSQILGPKGLKSTYTFSGEKLVVVKNAWKNTYKYDYDDLYNLTKVNYPDGKYIALSYDKDKDWVLSFRDREACVETYKYAQAKADPLNNYSSNVIKKCGKDVTNQSKYEFWHKVKNDGTRYLAKSSAEINGKKTETEYHPDHGRPIRHLEDGFLTIYEYGSDGLMVHKIQPGRDSKYTYDDKCMKPSKVSTNYAREVLDPDDERSPAKTPKTKTIRKTVTTDYRYEPRGCNLISAQNSEGQYAKLSYDRMGRIVQIEDQSKKLVNITYEERFGKPLVVDRPGLGRIRFKYKANGELEKIESDDEPLVAVQVANMFSNLLEIIGPGTTDTTI